MAGKTPRKSAAHALQMARLAEAAAQAKPTAFHELLGALHSIGVLGRVYTQNIDDLKIKAGLTTDGNHPNCVQLHGSAELFTLPHLFRSESARIPSCPIGMLGIRAEFTRNFFGRSYCQSCIPSPNFVLTLSE
jgi:Sir2 family